MAKIFNVPVALSGQTVGLWGNKINKHIARRALRYAKVITCRDPKESIRALNNININKNRYFVTCDDALYCDKEIDETVINRALSESGIKTSQKFITLNIHYWGIEGKAEKDILLSKINSIIHIVKKVHDIQILIIPMTPSDEITIDDYLKKYKTDKCYKFKYEYDFKLIRSVISKSQVCITMKHHPIIFAMGEHVPVITLSQFKYYRHKNIGALRIFNMDKFNINLEDDNILEDFYKKYLQVNIEADKIKQQISNVHHRIKKSQKRFIDILHSCISR